MEGLGSRTEKKKNRTDDDMSSLVLVDDSARKKRKIGPIYKGLGLVRTLLIEIVDYAMTPG